jgi:hypothetical protein
MGEEGARLRQIILDRQRLFEGGLSVGLTFVGGQNDADV